RVADQNESVFRALFRTVGVVDYRIDFIDALGACDSLAARFAFLDLLVENLRQIFAAIFHQVIGIGDDTDAGNVVLEGDIPEPAAAPGRSAQHERRAAIQIR